MLIMVRDGMEVRNSMTDTRMHDISSTDDQEEQLNSKSGIISFRDEHAPLQEIVGEDEITSIVAGGKDPQAIGFRVQTDLFDVLHQHILVGHEPRLDQYGMEKYVNWTEEMAYGRAVPLGHNMANFADPKWGNCRFDGNTLRKGYEHSAIKNYTRFFGDFLAILHPEYPEYRDGGALCRRFNRITGQVK